MLPGPCGREREGGEAGGFGGGDAEQAQLGLGELVDGALCDAVGVPLAYPPEPEQAADHSAEGDFGVGTGEPADGLSRLDVALRARRQAIGGIQGVQASAVMNPASQGGQEPPEISMPTA